MGIRNPGRGLSLSLLLSFLYVTISATAGFAEETVTWAYFSYPPLFVTDKHKDPEGFGFDIINLAISSMPEYEHSLKKIPIKRFMEQMKAGKDCVCSYGMIRTRDREKWALFSYPCRIIMPRMVVIRKRDLERFGRGSPVSLSELIEDESLTLLLKRGTRYGKRIDRILNEHRGSPNITYLYSDNLGQQALKMLMAGRGDYFLSLSSTTYDAEKLGYADRIALIPIEGESYLTGRVACSRNETGKRIIERVNEMLRKEIPNGRIYRILSRWVPGRMRREFKKMYEELLVAPLKQ